MKQYFRRHYEAFLIRVAASILIDRNVARCKVVSRRDNNDMWYMADQLESISKRIAEGYNKETTRPEVTHDRN